MSPISTSRLPHPGQPLARVSRHVTWAACIVGAGCLAWAYGVFLRAPAVGTFHDDGVYLVTAKSLAEHRGYRIISLPGEPRQTKYPVLFPLLLSLAWRVNPSFPSNVPWLRIVPFGAGLAWMLLSCRMLRRLHVPWEATAIIALTTAASPWTLFLSTSLLSETVFAALLTGALLVLVRICEGGAGARAELSAGLLMGAALLTRTAGVAAAAGGLAALALHRKWRACGRYAAGVVLWMVPWILWVAGHRSEPVLDPFYSAANYESWNLVLGYPWREKILIGAVNAVYASQLEQLWGINPGSRPGVWLGLLTCALVIRGAWYTRRSPVTTVVGTYVLALLLWAFPPIRFLVPVLPLTGWLAFVGAGKHRVAAALIAAILLGAAGPATWRLAAEVERKGGTWFSADRVPDWQALRRQHRWIERHAGREAVLVGIYDPTYFLFTGRRAVRPFSIDPLLMYYNVGRRPDSPLGTVDDFRRRLIDARADFVLASPGDGLQPMLRDLAGIWPHAVEPVQADLAPGYPIYRVDRQRLTCAGADGRCGS